ncbi:myo-inositol-1(or 4)-monophosphatase [Amycolatopsis bartoniae]|uniref:Inositol-1-monophosphatase n=1 Tax=Amycolatopsis bartoniae TaxID=941986 RepID=A0A8H9MET2_9PSEU|nr:inositol monophosphatase family protein [Amycolatopsis bartoniae]MBB2939107.1 myo-inositol-1(or 4)-monophosphatase [Amycolatopsis bartoniae]GHF64861.1 inositol monophosphatase [Amycolatopsis bartoniae]
MGAFEFEPEDLGNTAVGVAREAADLVRRAREAMLTGETVQVDTKSTDTDVVTAVDRASERLIRERLAELRPADAVLGEEEGGGAGDGVTWVVDPIDGTVNFLYGLPGFAVSVAAQVGGVSVAGAVVEPVSGRCWTAVRGHGAWLDGRRLHVSSPARLDLTLVGTGFAYDVARRARQAEVVSRLVPRVRDIRRAGAASLDLCAVAAGWLDAYVEHGLSPWDWAAGALVAREAGALVTLPGEDEELGKEVTYAASPAIAAELRAVLLECGIADA